MYRIISTEHYLYLIFFGVLLTLPYSVISEALNLSQCDSFVRRTDGVVCYKAIDTQDVWSNAQLVCNARNFTMLDILTNEENSAVLELLGKKGMVDSWLAAVQSKETWRWLDGTEINDQGCFLDNPDSPDLKVFEDFGANNSVTKCVSYCGSHSYLYASVEARTFCHCGDEFGKYGQEGANCGNQCPGNASETCGGDKSQQVYAVNGVRANWLGGQPNNNAGYQSCATISAFELKWQDVYCRDGYRALCEIPLVSNTSCSQSNPRSFEVNGRCIQSTETDMNFFNARYACRSLGGDLLMRISAEDTAVMAKKLNLSSNSTTQYYIGLTKWAWKWQTGNEFLYTNWRYDQPTGPDLNCVTIKGDTTPGEWADISCDSSHLFICQRSNATAKVTAPLFTVQPSTTRRTAPPPITLTTTRGPLAPASLTTPLTPSSSASNSTSTTLKLPAIIGGAVAGGVVFLAVIIFIVIICVVSRRRRRSSPPKSEKAEVDGASSDPAPPSYFFGIETTPKYRNEKRQYPSLPEFDEKSSNSRQHKSPKNSTSNTPDIAKAYSNSILGSENHYFPTHYSSDIFINPELSY